MGIWPAAYPPTPTAPTAAQLQTVIRLFFIEYTPMTQCFAGSWSPGGGAMRRPRESARTQPGSPLAGKISVEGDGRSGNRNRTVVPGSAAEKAAPAHQLARPQPNVADAPATVAKGRFGQGAQAHAVVADAELHLPARLTRAHRDTAGPGHASRCWQRPPASSETRAARLGLPGRGSAAQSSTCQSSSMRAACSAGAMR